MKKPDWLVKEADQESCCLWFRTPMGLESLGAEEIAEKLPVAHTFQTHRNVFVQLAKGSTRAFQEAACRLRLVDDAYDYWGGCEGIDRSKDSVGRIDPFLASVLQNNLSAFDAGHYIRPTVSFVGKRNFNRFFVESRISHLLRQFTAMKILSNEDQDGKVAGEIRLRCHLEDDRAYFGLGLKDTPLHRRSWRGIRYTGQLHTTVAAAMARVLNAPTGSHIIDPFCGSGTILIESALQYPSCTFEGWDLNAEALDISRQSAAQAGVQLTVKVMDSMDGLPETNGYYLLSNPPWDEKHQISDGNLKRFVSALGDWLQKSAVSVLLLPEELVLLLEEHLGRPGERIATTRVRGKLAELVCFVGEG